MKGNSRAVLTAFNLIAKALGLLRTDDTSPTDLIAKQLGLANHYDGTFYRTETFADSRLIIGLSTREGDPVQVIFRIWKVEKLLEVIFDVPEEGMVKLVGLNGDHKTLLAVRKIRELRPVAKLVTKHIRSTKRSLTRRLSVPMVTELSVSPRIKWYYWFLLLPLFRRPRSV